MDDWNAEMAGRAELALLTTGQMAKADRVAIAAGTPGIVLMERAGRAVADAVLARAGAGGSVTLLCGPGNNGGDGFIAARLLREHGMAVRVVAPGGADGFAGDAAIALARWAGPVEPPGAAPADVFVDALFGAGLTRPLAGAFAEAAAMLNAAGRPVIAVDMPSGVSGDTGRAEGLAVEASETVTFFRLKPGHLLQPGRSLCGRVTVADIGIPVRAALAAVGMTAFRNDVALWRRAWPEHAADTHKFRRGALAVLAGGVSGVGAPRLGARAALRAGAGLATLLCEPEALPAHAARGPDALMQQAVADAGALAAFLEDRRISAVLAGPALGLGRRAGDLVRAVIADDRPAVLDADALTLIAGWPDGGVRSLRGRRPETVLTPHAGEFQRLFGNEPGIAAEPSKLERARRAAALSGAVVVDKGPDTVVAAPDGRAAINATGTAALATAGSGDVLAGLIAGLLAQGMPAFEAACAAVWLHGLAGERLGMGLIADDLPEAVPPLLRDVLALRCDADRKRPAPF
ncbi:NAD(P)H-hydrate dehydratase [Bosea sp. (in: a-proteobacteria)]|uniref:NAD(P)H-hydrate dehydratase n=1 Tax=Bosea sp. (in: a-proteobacteria) TaxID=1871050 RepID=UPI002636FFEE|nr:NAD(P)H-hydrate dehydratase [Bosea sp. (in: a-proteobacteria)]MCO5093018.1 NAD(P)H-hydrate dehydratase [Bosea sp. (in: a-proteobacteria)]